MSAAEYLLVKRGFYYRPDNHGYTGIKTEAGRYFESDACPESGVQAVHQDEAPLFSPACWHDVKVKYLLAHIERIEALNASYREALEPSGDTKAAYMGEFTFTIMQTEEDEDGDLVEAPVNIHVPWDTIKQIMAAIRARAALSKSATLNTDASLGETE